jgi:hypothetical protein
VLFRPLLEDDLAGLSANAAAQELNRPGVQNPRARKDRLAAKLERPPAAIRHVEHLDGEHGPAAFLAACRMGLEGIVSKRVDRSRRQG